MHFILNSILKYDTVNTSFIYYIYFYTVKKTFFLNLPRHRSNLPRGLRGLWVRRSAPVAAAAVDAAVADLLHGAFVRKPTVDYVTSRKMGPNSHRASTYCFVSNKKDLRIYLRIHVLYCAILYIHTTTLNFKVKIFRFSEPITIGSTFVHSPGPRTKMLLLKGPPYRLGSHRCCP